MGWRGRGARRESGHLMEWMMPLGKTLGGKYFELSSLFGKWVKSWSDLRRGITYVYICR